jgi:hypothetical protein
MILFTILLLFLSISAAFAHSDDLNEIYESTIASTNSEFLTNSIINDDLGFTAIKGYAEGGGDLTVGDNLLLRFAVLLGREDIVQYLLELHPVDPSAENNEAIRSAAEYNHINIAKTLMLDSRVDISVAESMVSSLNCIVDDIITGDIRVPYYPIIIAGAKGHWGMV